MAVKMYEMVFYWDEELDGYANEDIPGYLCFEGIADSFDFLWDDDNVPDRFIVEVLQLTPDQAMNPPDDVEPVSFRRSHINSNEIEIVSAPGENRASETESILWFRVLSPDLKILVTAILMMHHPRLALRYSFEWDS